MDRTKVIGDGLKDLVPVQDWVAGARKEALWLSFRADTKQALLERLGKTISSHRDRGSAHP